VADDITIEVGTEADWDPMVTCLSGSFNETWDEPSAAAEHLFFEPERALVARRDGEIVGTAAIITRRISVPGGLVPAGHVTLVGVHPTARRQRVLTRFMRRQFDDMRAAGEPIAVLWASEGRIYQRFGYGLAARHAVLEADTRELRIKEPPTAGRIREAAPADARATMEKIFDQVYGQRPGYSERAPRHWDYRLVDHESWRMGMGPLKVLLHENPAGEVDGYALWRVHGNWTDGSPDGDTRALEVISTDPIAYAALWHFLLTVDLTRTARMRCAAIDEPLQYLVNEPRRLNLTLRDSLWLRIVDVPGALIARRYAGPVDVVIEVADPIIDANAGRWRLTAGRDSATCVPTTDPADLSCGIQALASAYLGDAPLTTLAAAGLVREETPGSLASATTAFGWHQLPSAIESF
jgi:predicted acetyltransferase